MKCFSKILLTLILILTVSGFFPRILKIYAQSSDERLQQLSSEIQKYEAELKRLGAEKDTLSNQIAQYDAQIRLTTLKISQTEEKITLLGGRIDLLKGSLESLKSAFVVRANQTYKMARFSEPYLLMLSANNLTDVVSTFHYLKRVQEADRDLLDRLQKARETYIDQKSEQEDLQEELEGQKSILASQRVAKTQLLAQTKNSEKQYQSLLAQARSEFEAIQAILSGKGQEEKVGHIGEGDRIATIIAGASCNSSGEHLHFVVGQNRQTLNPFSYLRSGVSYENCSGSSCGGSDPDSFNPTGSWIWPVNEKIKFTQGYGSTWAIRNTWVGRIYNFHNGIDIDGESSNDVKAVKSGDLYRGSYSGSSGCRLRYVRVDHDDSDLETYYLHINY